MHLDCKTTVIGGAQTAIIVQHQLVHQQQTQSHLASLPIATPYEREIFHFLKGIVVHGGTSGKVIIFEWVEHRGKVANKLEEAMLSLPQQQLVLCERCSSNCYIKRLKENASLLRQARQLNGALITPRSSNWGAGCNLRLFPLKTITKILKLIKLEHKFSMESDMQ